MAQQVTDPALIHGATSIHHYLCAYVGPPQSFARTAAGWVCPKCRRLLGAGGRDWEVLENPFCSYPAPPGDGDEPRAAGRA